MGSNRNFIGWGLFLIVFGGVLLGVRQGWIPTELAQRAWQLWPVLLVASGLSLILARRPGAWIGGLVAAVCFGVIAGGLVSTGVGLGFIGCGGDENGSSFPAQSGELSSSALVSIDFRCGDLTVQVADGATWQVTGESDVGRPPVIDATPVDLRVEPAEGRTIFGFGRSRDSWNLTLPADTTMDLDLTLNAGEGRLVMAGAHLGSTELTVNAGALRLDLRDIEAARTLDGTVNAGSAVVWLPDRPLEGDITVNAGSLVLCAPAEVGLRLDGGNSPLSSNDFDEGGLVRIGDAWETPGFATAAIRIVLDVQANAGSMSLNPRDTCSG